MQITPGSPYFPPFNTSAKVTVGGCVNLRNVVMTLVVSNASVKLLHCIQVSWFRSACSTRVSSITEKHFWTKGRRLSDGKLNVADYMVTATCLLDIDFELVASQPFSVVHAARTALKGIRSGEVCLAVMRGWLETSLTLLLPCPCW